MVKIYELTGFKHLKSNNFENIRHNATYICLSITDYLKDKEMLLFLSEIHDVDMIEDIIPMLEKNVEGNQIKKLHIGIYQDDEDETLDDSIIILCSKKMNPMLKKIKALIKRELSTQKRLN